MSAPREPRSAEDALAIWFDGYNWVAAETADDATVVAVGADCEECGPWEMWPEDKPLSVTDDDGQRETKLPAEWIAKLGGRAHVASVNY